MIHFTGFSVALGVALFTASVIGSIILIQASKGKYWRLSSIILILGFGRMIFSFDYHKMHVLRVPVLYPDINATAKLETQMGLTVWQVALCVSILGSILFIILLSRHIAALNSARQRAKDVPEDSDVYRLCKQSLAHMGYTGPFRLATTDAFSTAASAGFFKPCILLPENVSRMPLGELDGIFRHEITHYLKGDMWINIGLLLVQCLLWWNIFVSLTLHWLGSKILELRCDEAVRKTLDAESRKMYRKAMVHTLEAPSKAPMGYLGFSEKKTIQHRIHVFSHSKPQRKTIAAVSITLSTIAFMLSYTCTVQPASLPDQEYLDSVGAFTMDGTESEILIIRRLNGDNLLIVDGREIARLSDVEVNSPAYADVPTYDEKADE